MKQPSIYYKLRYIWSRDRRTLRSLLNTSQRRASGAVILASPSPPLRQRRRRRRACSPIVGYVCIFDGKIRIAEHKKRKKKRAADPFHPPLYPPLCMGYICCIYPFWLPLFIHRIALKNTFPPYLPIDSPLVC